ncbi:hypothetical protein [Halosolutus gelatinilyticus]|uniref:hypothetical protein n=1 Tax=Halosolutus gelatinilyticus TaxID=2931975 RepID=UPI001FF44C8E|nr:hypothetical protein [Halosolutus gelatinilyticus]
MRISIQYYDLVLLGILFSLVLGAVLGYVTSFSTALTVPVVSVLGIALIYHAIFRGGPVNTAEDLAEEVQEIELLE